MSETYVNACRATALKIAEDILKHHPNNKILVRFQDNTYEVVSDDGRDIPELVTEIVNEKFTKAIDDIGQEKYRRIIETHPNAAVTMAPSIFFSALHGYRHAIPNQVGVKQLIEYSCLALFRAGKEYMDSSLNEVQQQTACLYIFIGGDGDNNAFMEILSKKDIIH